MEFGFLIDETRVECKNFEICTLDNFIKTMAWFHESAEVSGGWIYPPMMTLKQNQSETTNFKKHFIQTRGRFFSLPTTHLLTAQNYTKEHKEFLILGYGLLQGLYLNPKGYKYLGKIPYKSSKLNNLILTKNDRVLGMEQINKFYLKANREIRNQMSACIHWFLIAQTFELQWEVFDAQYKVLDGLFRLYELIYGEQKKIPHFARPIKLAEKFKLDLPEWINETQINGKKTSTLAYIRNELFHEAKYASSPIGYNYPEENFRLQFPAFNLKILCSFLEIATLYLKAPANNRLVFNWNIQ